MQRKECGSFFGGQEDVQPGMKQKKNILFCQSENARMREKTQDSNVSKPWAEYSDEIAD
jgi:hypothetical protein